MNKGGQKPANLTDMAVDKSEFNHSYSSMEINPI